jgi:FkbM family methyltransferase
MEVEPRRHTFLVGCLVGVVLASGLAFLAGRASTSPDAQASAVPSGSTGGAPLPPLNSFPEVSFAQQGEDLIIKQLFGQLGITNATYVDIGAHDPIRNSNTYLFYALGSRGVLVEPNPVYAKKLREVRPRDTVIAKGVGVTGEAMADYYDFGEDGQENTFSKEQADKLVALGMKLRSVVKMPLVSVNDVLAQNFRRGAPSLVSIDTEGLDLAILKSLDFGRWRPPVICAETAEVGSNRVLGEIAEFLRTKGYVARGGTFVNTVFVAEEALAASGRGVANDPRP